ncbi:MAG: multiubiquitin domain-containing protein [Thermoleophilia bacterium]|nr:multiubiquitin domain-containing protein [Thermoleophilia bacterium]
MTEAKQTDSPKDVRKIEIIIDKAPILVPRKTMTVREILALVDKTPDDWTLTLVRDRRDQHDFEDPEEKVSLKRGMIFATTHKGPKTVS